MGYRAYGTQAFGQGFQSRAPEFTFIALNRHGALLYIHSNVHSISGVHSGFFTELGTAPDSLYPSNTNTFLGLDTLDPRVAFVAIVTTKWGPDWVCATGPGGYTTRDELTPRDNTLHAFSEKRSYLSAVCCQGLDDRQWYLVRASAISHGPSVHVPSLTNKTRGGKASKMVDPIAEVAACVEVAQQWVAEYVKTCQVNGLNEYDVVRTDELP